MRDPCRLSLRCFGKKNIRTERAQVGVGEESDDMIDAFSAHLPQDIVNHDTENERTGCLHVQTQSEKEAEGHCIVISVCPVNAGARKPLTT